jgi:hypothetical protein
MWPIRKSICIVKITIPNWFVRTYQTSHRPNVYSRVVYGIGQRQEVIEDGLWCSNLQRSVQGLRNFGTEECYENLASREITEAVVTNPLPSRRSLRACRPVPQSPPNPREQPGIWEVNRYDVAGLERTRVRIAAPLRSSSRSPRAFRQDQVSRTRCCIDAGLSHTCKFL